MKVFNAESAHVEVLDWRRQVAKAIATVAPRVALTLKARAVSGESQKIKGHRRIAQVLNKRGPACWVGLVTDVMRKPDLNAGQPRECRACISCSGGDRSPENPWNWILRLTTMTRF